MEPIAVYSECRLSGKREFALYPDRVDIKGKVFLKSDYEATVELRNINPKFEKIRVREPAFMGGVGLVVVAFIIMDILHWAFGVEMANEAMRFMIGLAVAGFFVCAVTFKKVEFYRFKNHSGTAVMDIARSGKEKHKFDSFVEQIISCVNECQTG